MTKYFKIIIYYLLLLVGLITTSWIIWSRFIRERTIRDIPDPLLIEYRVWILVYICSIYAIIIKSLISYHKDNNVISEFFEKFREYIFKPLTLLDRAIKYNKFTKTKYETFTDYVIPKMYNIKSSQKIVIITILRIIPRIVLVIFLYCDTFWFHRLELIYKAILIGLIPFIYRYIKYSIKDIKNYLIETLEKYYHEVIVYEKGYIRNIRRLKTTKAKYHYQRMSIKEYVDIKFDNILDYLNNTVTYEYVGNVYPHKHIYIEYCKKKYGHENTDILINEDYDKLREKYEEIMPKILEITGFLADVKAIEYSENWIRYTKIGIYSIYILCWSFILGISYYEYPIELPMFKYLIRNIAMYLMIMDNQFGGIEMQSINENLITIDSVKDLIIKIVNKFL